MSDDRTPNISQIIFCLSCPACGRPQEIYQREQDGVKSVCCDNQDCMYHFQVESIVMDGLHIEPFDEEDNEQRDRLTHKRSGKRCLIDHGKRCSCIECEHCEEFIRPSGFDDPCPDHPDRNDYQDSEVCLKPCPFCGKSKASTVEVSSGEWVVYCRYCGVQTGFRIYKEDVVEDWNDREASMNKRPCSLTDNEKREIAKRFLNGEGIWDLWDNCKLDEINDAFRSNFELSEE